MANEGCGRWPNVNGFCIGGFAKFALKAGIQLFERKLKGGSFLGMVRAASMLKV